jgi:hypothetical protein
MHLCRCPYEEKPTGNRFSTPEAAGTASAFHFSASKAAKTASSPEKTASARQKTASKQLIRRGLLFNRSA